MKSPLLTALIIVIAASVSRGEDSVTQKIAEAVAPLPIALRDGAEVFTYDSDWQRAVLQAGTNSVRCHAPDSSSLAPVIRAQCFHRSWEAAMVRMTQLTAKGKSFGDAFQMVVTEIESGKLQGPDAGAKAVWKTERIRRINRRASYYLLQRQPQMHELGERRSKIKYWTIDIVMVQITRDSAGQKVLRDRFLGNIEGKTAKAMTDVEMYASLHGGTHLRQHSSPSVEYAWLVTMI